MVYEAIDTTVFDGRQVVGFAGQALEAKCRRECLDYLVGESVNTAFDKKIVLRLQEIQDIDSKVKTTFSILLMR